MKPPRGLEIGNAGNAVNSLVYSERPRFFLAAWWLRRGEFADITNSVISVKQLGLGLVVGWQLIACEESGSVLVLRVVRRKAE
jgi:hypothetical protein